MFQRLKRTLVLLFLLIIAVPVLLVGAALLKPHPQQLPAPAVPAAYTSVPAGTVPNRVTSPPAAIERPLSSTPRRHGRGGCGSRGGAGYRLPNGRCAGRRH